MSTNQYVTVGLEQGKNNDFKDYSDPTKSDYRSKETTQNSVCVQDTISLSSGTLTLSLRFDDNSQYGDGTSPTVGHVHDRSGDTKLKFNFAQVFKAPNIKEGDSNYTAGHGPTTKFKGNSSLKPETSQSFEFGISGGGNSFDYSESVDQTKVVRLQLNTKVEQEHLLILKYIPWQC